MVAKAEAAAESGRGAGIPRQSLRLERLERSAIDSRPYLHAQAAHECREGEEADVGVEEELPRFCGELYCTRYEVEFGGRGCKAQDLCNDHEVLL